MLDNVSELRRFRILDDLSQDELEAIAQIATVQTFPERATLTREGLEANRLYLLLEGKVLITVESPDGREGVLDEVMPGEEVGWSAVVAPYRYTATSHTTETSRAIVLEGADLRRLFETSHHMGYSVVKNAGHVISRRYGQAIGEWGELREKDLRAFRGGERTVWEGSGMRLTTEAVLFETDSDRPDVVPLEAVYDVEVDGDYLVMHAKGGDVRSARLENAEELASLVRDELRRARLAYRRAAS